MQVMFLYQVILLAHLKNKHFATTKYNYSTHCKKASLEEAHLDKKSDKIMHLKKSEHILNESWN